jgi:hypothetical protein
MDAGRRAVPRPSVGPTPRHCRQSAAVVPVPHQGVAAEPPLGEDCGRLRYSGRMKLLHPAASARTCLLRRIRRRLGAASRAVSGSRSKGSAGKFQSLFLDIRIKEWRQSNAKPRFLSVLHDAFQMVVPSTLEIRLPDPHAVYHRLELHRSRHISSRHHAKSRDARWPRTRSIHGSVASAMRGEPAPSAMRLSCSGRPGSMASARCGSADTSHRPRLSAAWAPACGQPLVSCHPARGE